MANRPLLQTYLDIGLAFQAPLAGNDAVVSLQDACEQLAKAYREHVASDADPSLPTGVLRAVAMSEALFLVELAQDRPCGDVILARQIGSLRELHPRNLLRQRIRQGSAILKVLENVGLDESVNRRTQLAVAIELSKRAFCWGSLGDYSSAVTDCNHGLEILKSCPNDDIALLPRLILGAILVMSKSGVGDLSSFDSDATVAIATFDRLVTAKRPGEVVREATLARRALEMRVSYPTGSPSVPAGRVPMSNPERAKPFLSKLTQLMSLQEYRQVTFACEKWAAAAAAFLDVAVNSNLSSRPGPNSSAPPEREFKFEYYGDDEMGFAVSLAPGVRGGAECLPSAAWRYYVAALRMSDRVAEARAYVDELDGVVTSPWVYRESLILRAAELRTEGEERRTGGVYGQAIECFIEARKLLSECRPESAEGHAALAALVHYGLAACYKETGEIAASIKNVELSLKYDAKHVEALELQACCQRELQRGKESIGSNGVPIKGDERANTSPDGRPEYGTSTFPSLVDESQHNAVAGALLSSNESLETSPNSTASDVRDLGYAEERTLVSTGPRSSCVAAESTASSRSSVVLQPIRLSHKRVKPIEPIIQAFEHFGFNWESATSEDVYRAYRQGMRDLHPDKTRRNTNPETVRHKDHYALASSYLDKYHTFDSLGLRMDCMSMKSVDSAYTTLFSDGSRDSHRAAREACLKAKKMIALQIVGATSDSISIMQIRQKFESRRMYSYEKEAVSFLEETLAHASP
jgi:tetratricopeptide (TPR) repeat protein